MAPLYLLESVTVRYGGAVALEIPALAVREGGAFALVGPNGAGKSTLLSLLAFLLFPDSGTVRYAGEPVDRRAAALGGLRREATLLHQSPYLFEGSVSANVGYGPAVRGVHGDARRRRIAESLEMVGLAGFGPRRAKALSGGEAQRVALARALAVRPRVLLLDEPFAGVDRRSAEAIGAVLEALPERGTTVIVATHDPAHAARIGGETIRLEEGRLCGAPSFGLRSSQHLFGADRDALL